jgi:hypothetical protein
MQHAMHHVVLACLLHLHLLLLCVRIQAAAIHTAAGAAWRTCHGPPARQLLLPLLLLLPQHHLPVLLAAAAALVLQVLLVLTSSCCTATHDPAEVAI